MSQAILTVEHLSHVYNRYTAKPLKAVDDLSFHIEEGETFGLVGESGCGKSTTGKAILQLQKPTHGDIQLRGKSIFNLKTKEQKAAYRKSIQMIFQDPYSSLNPKLTVENIVGESMEVFSLVKNREEKREKITELLELVGLEKSYIDRYPHEFSGGQRQRIGIARALAVTPELIVCDEPISSLDVSVQAQIVNLLKELQSIKKLSYLFIAHDLSMVKYISRRIGVMYRGKLVELATSEELYENPLHPYTKSLLSTIPVPEPLVERKRQAIAYTPQTWEGRNLELREVSADHFVLCDESGGY
nr:ATP-binding cassette domain-containing protein [Scatolibacter rhodanostii]